MRLKNREFFDRTFSHQDKKFFTSSAIKIFPVKISLRFFCFNTSQRKGETFSLFDLVIIYVYLKGNFMKKVIALTTLFVLSSTAMAQGGFHDVNNPRSQKHSIQQGFFDESAAVKTVKDALNAQDDTFVLIEGNIVKQIDKDEFIFKDASGEIEIDVSKKAWNGQTVSPQDKVQIRGKVDTEWNRTEIDVKQVVKL